MKVREPGRLRFHQRQECRTLRPAAARDLGGQQRRIADAHEREICGDRGGHVGRHVRWTDRLEDSRSGRQCVRAVRRRLPPSGTRAPVQSFGLDHEHAEIRQAARQPKIALLAEKHQGSFRRAGEIVASGEPVAESPDARQVPPERFDVSLVVAHVVTAVNHVILVAALEAPFKISTRPKSRACPRKRPCPFSRLFLCPLMSMFMVLLCPVSNSRGFKMTFRLWVRGHTRAQIDAELGLFAKIIRARMNASPQAVEIIVPALDVLGPGGGQRAFLALQKLVYRRFDREGYEPSIVERDAENGPFRRANVSFVRSPPLRLALRT
jgi:hypothetical protein